MSGSLIAVYKVCSNEREEWNQEEQSTKNRREKRKKRKRPFGALIQTVMCLLTATEEQRDRLVVLSINKHLDPVALPAGLRLPQAVLTKQTSPL